MKRSIVDFTVSEVVQVTASQKTPKCKIPYKFAANMTWTDGNVQIVWFNYHKSGNNRDTHSADEFPWIIKTEPRDYFEMTHTRGEWQTYLAAGEVPIPKCYGFFTVNIAGRDVELLVMDRIAFTLADFLDSMSRQVPTLLHLQLVRRLIMSTMVRSKETLQPAQHEQDFMSAVS